MSNVNVIEWLTKLEQSATPGPWEAWDYRGRPLYNAPPDLGGKLIGHSGPGDHGVLITPTHNIYTGSVKNDQLIAAMRNAFPDLLAVVDAAQTALDAFDAETAGAIVGVSEDEWDALQGDYMQSIAALRSRLARLQGDKEG